MHRLRIVSDIFARFSMYYLTLKMWLKDRFQTERKVYGDTKVQKMETCPAAYICLDSL